MDQQKRIAAIIDKGYIDKCAEYGINWNNPKDRRIIAKLMQISLNNIGK